MLISCKEMRTCFGWILEFFIFDHITEVNTFFKLKRNQNQNICNEVHINYKV